MSIKYLFSMSPVFPDTSWCKSFNSSPFTFFFFEKNKTPGIKLSAFQKNKIPGRMREWHLLVNQLKYLIRWTKINPSKLDCLWIETERNMQLHTAIRPPIYQPKPQDCWSLWSIDHNHSLAENTSPITNSTAIRSLHWPIWNNPDFSVNKKKTQNSTFHFLEGHISTILVNVLLLSVFNNLSRSLALGIHYFWITCN